MESRAIRRAERRKGFRRSSDRTIHRDIVDMFHEHLQETSGGFERLESAEDNIQSLNAKFDRVETRLNMILGGLAVIAFTIPLAVTFLQ